MDKQVLDFRIVLYKRDVDNKIETFWADPILLEQVMINLIKNAIEAAAHDMPHISIKVVEKRNNIEICISDGGPGITNPENLFVPFYTTKDEGNGIGLVLSRNIIEQHKGTLRLFNNENGVGATAEVTLPKI